MEDVENGLIQKKSISGVEIKAFYKTCDYNMLKELGPENMNDSLQVNAYKLSNGALQFYELNISTDSVDFIEKQSANNQDYHNQLYYFTFSFQNDIKLIYPGKDTLTPIIYHFERAYSLSNKKKMLLAFSLPEKNEGDCILEIDSRLLPTGVVNLYFSEKDIDKANKTQLKY